MIFLSRVLAGLSSAPFHLISVLWMNSSFSNFSYCSNLISCHFQFNCNADVHIRWKKAQSVMNGIGTYFKSHVFIKSECVLHPLLGFFSLSTGSNLCAKWKIALIGTSIVQTGLNLNKLLWFVKHSSSVKMCCCQRDLCYGNE